MAVSETFSFLIHITRGTSAASIHEAINTLIQKKNFAATRNPADDFQIVYTLFSKPLVNLNEGRVRGPTTEKVEREKSSAPGGFEPMTSLP